MAQARAVGVPTAEVLGLEHLDYDGELLSFSIQQFLPGRSLDELVGELPASDLERLVVDAGELLARVHSVVPDDERGIRHELRMPEEREVARVEEALGPAAATVVERGADFLYQEVTARPAPPFSLAQGDFCPKNLLIHDGTIAGVIDWALEKLGWNDPASPAEFQHCVDVIARYAAA
jgi:aminoglycoside phosphotransferase (APT) family kinase protein